MDNSLAPIIIKKKKVISGGGHHGGAWKVAYADFVTAMMAFFMLMWLLNATTEKQRKGIADYFNPTIPINRISGGGDGAFGGDSIFSKNTLAKSGTGADGTKAPWDKEDAKSATSASKTQAAENLLETLNAELIGQGGESELLKNTLKHVVSRISDEGVVIEIFALPGRPLFDEQGQASDILNVLATQLARIAARTENKIAIKSYSRTKPIVAVGFDPWRRTAQNSLSLLNLLEFGGVEGDRFDRLSGKGDNVLAIEDPLSVRNNRMEIVFLIDGRSN